LNDVQTTQSGQLAISARALCHGYLGQTLQVFQLDGSSWFSTADQAVKTPGGDYRLIGRLSELIVRGGRSIDPSEIEWILEGHDSVDRAVVFGIPSRVAGEEDIVALVTTSDDRVSPTMLRHHCMQQMGRAKTPQRVEVVDRLSETADRAVRRGDAREKFLATRVSST
jgi:fatty-acyl-CoA synthase